MPSVASSDALPYPRPRESGETFLFIFDFDDTIGEGDLDEHIGLALGLGEEFKKVLPTYGTPGLRWVELMSKWFGNFTKEEIASTVSSSVKIPPATIEAFRYLDTLRHGDAPMVEIAIASDANVLFIEESFKQIIKIPTPPIYSNGFVDLRETDEGPQTCPETGRTIYSRLTWQSPNSHNCQRCKACPNMCKSAIVQKALNVSKLRDPTIIFVGDGFNDSCPMQKVLRLRDHIFAHRGYRLEKILLEDAELKGVCHHHTWSTGEDLLALIKSTVSKRLPPLVLMGNEGGSPQEFRTRYVSSMMRGIIDRIILENYDEGKKEHEDVIAMLRQLCDDLSSSAKNPQALSDPKGLARRNDLLPIPSSLSVYGNSWQDLPWVHGCNYLYLLLWAIVWRYGSPQPVMSLGGDGPLSPLAVPVNEGDGDASWLSVDAVRAFAFPKPDTVPLENLATVEPQFDCFLSEKESVTATFFKSHIKPMILHMESFLTEANATNNPSETLATKPDAVKAEIRRLLSACVWGNTVDLSMFNRDELADLSKKKESPASGHPEDHNVLDTKVVANDMDAAAEYILSRLQHYSSSASAAAAATVSADAGTTTNAACGDGRAEGPATIDIVMDNMGVECAADMLLGLFLVSMVPNSFKVRYHTKPIPFCVSDVMPKDIARMIEFWEGDEATLGAAKRFRAALASKDIEVHTHPYWVHPSEYRDMPPSLVNAYFFSKRFGSAGPRCKAVRKHETKNFGIVDEIIDPKSDLVIFKGDVNFRRVCGDRHWTPAMYFLQSLTEEGRADVPPPGDRSVPFTEVIGNYWPHEVVPVLALRTNKSEVCVGPALTDMQRLDEETNMAWRCNGQYAVACFAHIGK